MGRRIFFKFLVFLIQVVLSYAHLRVCNLGSISTLFNCYKHNAFAFLATRNTTRNKQHAARSTHTTHSIARNAYHANIVICVQHVWCVCLGVMRLLYLLMCMFASVCVACCVRVRGVLRCVLRVAYCVVLWEGYLRHNSL